MTADASESPWERATGCSPGRRDVTRALWGYGWATLLAPAHLAAVGGSEALRSSGLVELEELPGGRVLLTLARDLAETSREDVAALRELLRPALPVGTRTLEEYRRDELEDPDSDEVDYLV